MGMTYREGLRTGRPICRPHWKSRWYIYLKMDSPTLDHWGNVALLEEDYTATDWIYYTDKSTITESRVVVEAQADDSVNQPPHYTHGPIEVIEVWEGFKSPNLPNFGLPSHLTHVIKYILRAGHKGDALEDLKKAQWYLTRYITLMERESD